MARFTNILLAKRDDPIYREGLTVFTPYTSRSPRAPNPPGREVAGRCGHTPRTRAPQDEDAEVGLITADKRRSRWQSF